MTTVIGKLVSQASQVLAKVKIPHVAGALGALVAGSICKTLYGHHQAKQALAAKNVEMQTQVTQDREELEVDKKILLNVNGRKLDDFGKLLVQQGLTAAQMALALMASGGGEGERKVQATINDQIATFKEFLGKHGATFSKTSQQNLEIFVANNTTTPVHKLKALMKCNNVMQLAQATVIASDQYEKNSMVHELESLEALALSKQKVDGAEKFLKSELPILVERKAGFEKMLENLNNPKFSFENLFRGPNKKMPEMRKKIEVVIAKLDGKISMLRKTLERISKTHADENVAFSK
ncbi:hypothetical protein COB21_01970 [Candidatus Aerophobetes bacterium]|uniref:Uncharacterized protein n=1 Tax=Aerophobetes bacterium TaxID=2030807 RepID=A0A2A4X762_UNCAE|nr:MAG: hypothetical protein COB21_01970 [Candidatus Aerophobetes bacterium]